MTALLHWKPVSRGWKPTSPPPNGGHRAGESDPRHAGGSPRAITPMAVGSGPGTGRSPDTVAPPLPTIEGARTITGWAEGGRGPGSGGGS